MKYFLPQREAREYAQAGEHNAERNRIEIKAGRCMCAAHIMAQYRNIINEKCRK